jgi:hypothetical protein
MHFNPCARAPARLVETIAALGDHAFKALLLHRSDEFASSGLQGFREANLLGHPGHDFGAEQLAAFVERTVAQVFSGEIQKIGDVELKRRGCVILVLKDVEGRSAGFVESHDRAVNDAVVRQLRQSFCNGRKPAEKSFSLRDMSRTRPALLMPSAR